MLCDRGCMSLAKTDALKMSFIRLVDRRFHGMGQMI